MPYETTSLEGDLDTALKTLETALAAAGGAVAVIRWSLPQISVLRQVVSEMELTMSRVREQLAATPQAIPAPSPQPAPLPQQVRPAPSAPETEADDSAGNYAEAPAGVSHASHCLRLDVRTGTGSLDLKEVDSSVNENPAVVDVALLDYDGSNAALKVWIDASDPDAVREELLESLQRRLDDGEAEIRIVFEEKSAA